MTTVTESPPDTPAGGRGVRRTVLSAAFFLAASAGLWLSLRGRIGTFTDQALRPDSVPYLLAAFAANSVGVLISLVTWRALLTGLGPPTSLPTAARIYFTSFLGKFVPGRVWGVVAQLRLGRAAGFSTPVMTGVFLLNLMVGTLTGLALGLVCGPALLGGRTWWLLLPTCVLAVWIARPGLLNHAVRAVLRAARRKPPGVCATDAGMRRSIAAATCSWLVSGLHLWVLAILFGADALHALPLCLGGFALATALSSLAIVLPDGWGAREAILMLALSTVLPWPTAGAVAVTSRVVCTLSEVAVAGGALLYARSRAGAVRSAAPADPSTSHPRPAPDADSRTGEQ